jgi:sugar phosphate isomerase/epimerase
MRIGLSGGPLPYDAREVDDRLALKLAELGFTGVLVHFGYGHPRGLEEADPGAWRHARDVLAAHGVRIVQCWGFAPTLVADEAARRGEVRRLEGALRLAREVDADAVLTGCGSLNPRGAYWPHRANRTPEARDRLVAALRAAAPAAELLGVTIALECHVLTTLDSPETAREIVQRIGSPAVGVNLDPVNFVGDLPTLYDSDALVERIFAELGHLAVSGHVKDVYPEDRLVLHLSETIPGDGEFDLRAYLRRFEEHLPDRYLFVEHLPEELVPRAKSILDGLLAELGIAA